MALVGAVAELRGGGIIFANGIMQMDALQIVRTPRTVVVSMEFRQAGVTAVCLSRPDQAILAERCKHVRPWCGNHGLGSEHE